MDKPIRREHSKYDKHRMFPLDCKSERQTAAESFECMPALQPVRVGATATSLYLLAPHKNGVDVIGSALPSGQFKY
jgi:hypothetical protein